jgi:hypothetical protein
MRQTDRLARRRDLPNVGAAHGTMHVGRLGSRSHRTLNTGGIMPANEQQPQAREDDVTRGASQIASRLPVSGREPPEALVRVEEAIERFEEAVRARGGDLMVDEPSPRGNLDPDDKHFVLPRPEAGESIGEYLQDIERATDRVRRHRQID